MVVDDDEKWTYCHHFSVCVDFISQNDYDDDDDDDDDDDKN